MEREEKDPSAEPPTLRGRVGALVQRLAQAEDHEVTAILWSGAYFFCVLTGYSILRPLREQLGIRGSLSDLPKLYTATMIGMFVAYPLYLTLVGKYPRRKFIPFVYRFAILNLLAFFVLMRFTTHETSVRVGQVFFVWLSVFNMFAISVFWSFMADIWRLEQSKRLFGFIAFGGMIGAIAGSSITVVLAEPLGPLPLLLVSAAFFEGSARIVNHLVRICGVQDEFAASDRATEVAARTPAPAERAARVPAPAERLEKTEHGGLFTGVGLVFRSGYLLNIGLYVLFYTWCSTFLYFEQAHIVKSALADDAARTKLFGQIDLAVNLIAATIQLGFTGRLVKRFGLGFALQTQPMLSLIAFSSLGFALSKAPVEFPGKALWVVVFAMVALRAANFATSKPAREMLYTVVGREVKYKSKSFIDTFVYRFGDVMSAWVFDRLKALQLGLPALAFSVVPVTLLWIVTGSVLRRRQEELARSDARIEADDLNPEGSRA